MLPCSSNPVAFLAIARQKRSHGRIVPNYSAFRKRNPFDLNSRPFISLCHCRVESKRGRIRCMKYFPLIILVALSTSLALADDFKTVAGKEYKNATVTHVEPDGIVVKSKSGISKIYFQELPKEVQQRFNYNPQQATAYSAQQAAAYSTIQKDQEQAEHQPQGRPLQDQPGLIEQQPAPETGAAGQGQRPTPFPRHTPRYTTVLHQLPQTYAPTPVPSTMTPKTPKTPTASNNPVHHAPAPATHAKPQQKKTHK